MRKLSLPCFNDTMILQHLLTPSQNCPDAGQNLNATNREPFSESDNERFNYIHVMATKAGLQKSNYTSH